MNIKTENRMRMGGGLLPHTQKGETDVCFSQNRKTECHGYSIIWYTID